MALSNQIAAYEDCFDLYETAAADPIGARAMFRTESEAKLMQLRMNQARVLERDEAKRLYPREDHRWNKSGYDNLANRIREGADGSWWLYVERHGQDIVTVETLSDLDHSPEPKLIGQSNET